MQARFFAVGALFLLGGCDMVAEEEASFSELEVVRANDKMGMTCTGKIDGKNVTFGVEVKTPKGSTQVERKEVEGEAPAEPDRFGRQSSGRFGEGTGRFSGRGSRFNAAPKIQLRREVTSHVTRTTVRMTGDYGDKDIPVLGVATMVKLYEDDKLISQEHTLEFFGSVSDKADKALAGVGKNRDGSRRDVTESEAELIEQQVGAQTAVTDALRFNGMGASEAKDEGDKEPRRGVGVDLAHRAPAKKAAKVRMDVRCDVLMPFPTL